jgi:two-component system, chemotaxis family, response regulator WspF
MKIAIVNDLPIAVEALRRALALAPEHEVVWVAYTGFEAVELCARQLPDLVLMDLLNAYGHCSGKTTTGRR